MTDNAVLKIEQKGPVDARPDGIYRWKLHWKLYGVPGHLLRERNVTLSEPFTSKRYDEIADYLDKSLDDQKFDQSDADEVSEKIDTYRKHLLDGLEICDHVRELRLRCLEVHICPDTRCDSETRSFHSIQWEQLEGLRVWEEDSGEIVPFITVCRHIFAPQSCQSLSTNTVQSLRQDRDGTFDVLLVVARPHVHASPETARGAFSVLNPGTVRSVLLELHEELNSAETPQGIRLEIVRPGCLEELKAHLEKRRSVFRVRRPYHLVHLDMHGGVSKGKAFLQFNGYKDDSTVLNTETVYAETLAKLLYKYEIDCVILSACKSAVAHAGPSANLSSVLLKHGISAVLAMSHNMHDSISKRFYSKFYSEFLVHHSSISTAASKARIDLYNDRTRWNYGKEAEVSMQDWFVPVVYTSSEDPYRFFSRLSWLPNVRFGVITRKELHLSLFGLIIICFFVAPTFCDYAEDGAVYCLNFLTPISTLQILVAVIAASLSSILVRTMLHRRRCWKMRQRLRVIAEDRQNVLRIEGDLRKRKMIFFHSYDDVEEYARPLLDSLAAIWETTHFVAFGGAIDAEWFVQPRDLTYRDDWRLWIKACTNFVCLWVYNLGHQHFSSTKEAKSVIIIENLDVLYPEEEVLRKMQHYASAQRRLENWLREHFSTQSARGPPYLMFTALRGRPLGESVSKWLEDGPGRCGVLESTAMTLFVKTSQRYVDPTNSSFDTDKWYDWSTFQVL
ncbi:MAG: hypothetical protein Q9160_006253 [Pyrenula sp. 1 TL-2023]